MENKEENKNLNESIASIKVKLQNAKLKKSGKNKFAGFDYFELADFLPILNKLMFEENINDQFSIITNEFGMMTASLTLIKGDERQEYTMPFTLYSTPFAFKKDKSGNYIKDREGNYIQVPSMQDVQYLGALNTYYKRYLYLNAFGITDGEVIDKMDTEDIELPKETPKQQKVLYKNLVANYIKNNNLDMKEICMKYKLNGKSTEADFKRAFDCLKEIKENASISK